MRGCSASGCFKCPARLCNSIIRSGSAKLRKKMLYSQQLWNFLKQCCRCKELATHTWVQGATAKISSAADGVSSAPPNPSGGDDAYVHADMHRYGDSSWGSAVGDCSFLHRQCKLLLVCLLAGQRSREDTTTSSRPEIGWKRAHK